jgi:2-haloacid dehalogenase
MPYVLDVNETLLDMSALDGVLEAATGVPGVRPIWFATVLQDAFTHALIGSNPPFGTLAAAALEVVATRHGRELGQDDRDALAAGLAALPAYGDVAPALRALHERGERLAVLAQAPADTLRAQLDAAGVLPCLEAVVSAQDVGRFKPAPETYRAALTALGVQDATMVAAHPWDLAGAAAAGLQTVLVRRPGVVADPSFPAPDRVVDDLRELL